MVRDRTISEIKTALDGPITVDCERRGYDRRRGVPDSVFWVKPADDRFSSRLLPILVELEGTFANAIDDFSKFASRYDDSGYQYSIEIPVIGDSAPDRYLKRFKYDVIGIRANSISDHHEIEEEEMHETLSSWFNRFKTNVETSTSLIRHTPQKIIEWQISFTMFGHNFETVFPIVISGHDSVCDETISRLTLPSLPCVVVINNKYDSRVYKQLQYETAIDFSTIHPIRFR